ncbi:MAG: hypothetical protein HQM09_16680 [Candidatus Riflebacteria bacterium]|nr:hypothetical protein [Candidatus Riflebacteria bacterium]
MNKRAPLTSLISRSLNRAYTTVAPIFIFSMLFFISSDCAIATEMATPSVGILARATLKSATGNIDIIKIQHDDGIYLEATATPGKKFWTSDNLGSEDKNFIIGGASATLAIRDIDGDGRDEIVTAAFYGPDASGLYVYRFMDMKTGFVPIANYSDTGDSEMNFFVSDIRQESGEDMVINNDGTVRIMGKIYSDNGNTPPMPGYYYYKLKDARYRLFKTEKIPGN